ncbi:hypothetical protein D3C86_1796210 [compost metagenome]
MTLAPLDLPLTNLFRQLPQQPAVGKGKVAVLDQAKHLSLHSSAKALLRIGVRSQRVESLVQVMNNSIGALLHHFVD